jgi:hypothetical protein
VRSLSQGPLLEQWNTHLCPRISSFGLCCKPCLTEQLPEHGHFCNTAVSNARRANAVCERFLLSVRRECLDHFLILHEKHLSGLLKADVVYFTQARPHQGLGQRIPDPPVYAVPPLNQPTKVIAVPILGGLHHDYRRAAKTVEVICIKIA